VGALRAERSALITEGNELKSRRNALSKQIGQLMQKSGGGGEEVAALKGQVGAASAAAAALDERLAQAERGIHTIMSCLPNLLDDAVPDGGDAAHNVEVAQWGTDRRKLGPQGAYRWHDELAQLLGVSGRVQ
jgi:seryl-tRNA synthetase